MLQVKDLHVHYQRIAALQGISLDVREGEIVGVIGPNGAGKSTLLNAIAGVVTPTSGAIELDGVLLLGTRAEQIVKTGISLVPEGRHIFNRLTVAENLELGATPRRDRTAVDDDIQNVLELFPPLRGYYRSPAGKLSGGEQQMLAIARALLARPRLLMLDEPSLGLAPIVIDRVFDTIEKLRDSGSTILIVEQNARRTVELADRTYVLRTGRIALSGVRADLLRDQEFATAYLGFAP